MRAVDVDAVLLHRSEDFDERQLDRFHEVGELFFLEFRTEQRIEAADGLGLPDGPAPLVGKRFGCSFDSIALTASCYSYRKLEDGENPHKFIQLMWCLLLIMLPIALVFSESSMNNLQSVSIVAAFPIGLVIVMIAVSFIKDAKKYLEE